MDDDPSVSRPTVPKPTRQQLKDRWKDICSDDEDVPQDWLHQLDQLNNHHPLGPAAPTHTQDPRPVDQHRPSHTHPDDEKKLSSPHVVTFHHPAITIDLVATAIQQWQHDHSDNDTHRIHRMQASRGKVSVYLDDATALRSFQWTPEHFGGLHVWTRCPGDPRPPTIGFVVAPPTIPPQDIKQATGAHAVKKVSTGFKLLYATPAHLYQAYMQGACFRTSYRAISIWTPVRLCNKCGSTQHFSRQCHDQQAELDAKQHRRSVTQLRRQASDRRLGVLKQWLTEHSPSSLQRKCKPARPRFTATGQSHPKKTRPASTATTTAGKSYLDTATATDTASTQTKPVETKHHPDPPRSRSSDATLSDGDDCDQTLDELLKQVKTKAMTQPETAEQAAKIIEHMQATLRMRFAAQQALLCASLQEVRAIKKMRDFVDNKHQDAAPVTQASQCAAEDITAVVDAATRGKRRAVCGESDNWMALVTTELPQHQPAPAADHCSDADGIADHDDHSDHDEYDDAAVSGHSFSDDEYDGPSCRDGVGGGSR